MIVAICCVETLASLFVKCISTPTVFLMHSYTHIPYSGLFSLGANFPKFHKWAHYSGKFILDCCMKFNCGSLLQKLARTQLRPDGL